MRRKKRQDYRLVWAEIILGAIVFAIIVKAYLFSGYVVPKQSMENTLIGGDVVLASKISYRRTSPKRGDLVVFKYPHNPSKYFIKRCIATSGETVEIRDKTLFVNDWIVPPPPRATFLDSDIQSVLTSNRDNFGPFEVPTNHIFVMGDNRDYSSDSRSWGAVPLNMVKAKPMIVYFSWGEDPNAPSGDGLIGTFRLLFYNILHALGRINFSRIGHVPR